MIKSLDTSSPEDLDEIKKIFIEYSSTLGFDLDFQDFQKELEDLPGEYAPPDGCILVAEHDSQVVGCVALRKIENGICEMKRLYVRNQFRGRGFGKELIIALINRACDTGYEFMRLDTVPSMKEAITLYKSFGFYEIESYRFNPIEGAVYFELDLMHCQELKSTKSQSKNTKSQITKNK